MKNSMLFNCVIICISSNCLSQELREQAIKNIGSSIAYIALCEKDGNIEKFFSSKLIITSQKTFAKITFEKLRTQYQNSLHEKKQYSIAKDNWFPMKIDKENCQNLEKAAPLLLNHFEELGKQFPKSQQ